MKILITNDDGIDAKGIEVLIEAMRPLGEIMVAAPATEQSGVGVGLTLFSPVEIQEHALSCKAPAFKVHGTPADCVRMALHLHPEDQFDLIVSGINRGSNLGRYVLTSGTVGAVIEGLFRGVPGIAFSCSNYEEPNYDDFIEHARSITRHIIEHPLPPHTLLNVNFPKTHAKGIRLTRQGAGHWQEELIKTSPTSYALHGQPLIDGEHPAAEVALLHEGYITASPIRIFELTDHDHLDIHKSIFEKKLNK